MIKLGLVVNPIAGMGGRVGLKGTDGTEILQEARRRGAESVSSYRTEETLRALYASKAYFELITYAGVMGEVSARRTGFDPKVIGTISGEYTTAFDTITACMAMRDAGVDLLLFAGGDGTARDVFDAIDGSLVVVGIPTGVKMHSAVFSCHPNGAAQLALLFIQNRIPRIKEGEVMDIDEEALRRGIVASRLYGYLKIPFGSRYVRGLKAVSQSDESVAQQAIAEHIARNLNEAALYIIGPGSTTREIMKRLGLEYTLLGVDLLQGSMLIAKDVTEKTLLMHMQERSTVKIIVTPIGGQGYLFGRGNQQISPEVISRTGKTNIIVVATPDKIASLHGRPLIVDTGNRAVDKMLDGFLPIITGYREKAIYRVTT